jgi:hypothetical protein
MGEVQNLQLIGFEAWNKLKSVIASLRFAGTVLHRVHPPRKARAFERRSVMKKKDLNPVLQVTYLEVVDNQLRANDPPETRKTYERLKTRGYDDRDARLLIASTIAAETYHGMKDGRPFNQERFVRNLDRLPDQSFDEQ